MPFFVVHIGTATALLVFFRGGDKGVFPNLDEEERARLDEVARRLAREREEAKKRAERVCKAAEAEAQRKATADAKKAAEIQAEMEELARQQNERDKAETYRQFIAAGGLKEDWEAFWRIRGPEIVAERMRQRRSAVASPRDYMHGLLGGSVQSLKPSTRPPRNAKVKEI